MSYGLGIDLGTTFTAAAVRRGDQVEVLRLGARRPEVPSVIFLATDGAVLVGEAAARRGETAPERVAREFKRRLGDPVPVLVGGAPYSAHALMARQLAHVVQTATVNEGTAPSSVVVTCPANWGPYKKDLLMQAARLADLPAVRLAAEPEAAAIEFAAGERIAPGETIAVYDLGGGTFDAAVLRRVPAGFELLGSPEGIEQLGGVDFDEAVFEHVVAAVSVPVADDAGTRAALVRLRRDCVEAKEALSEDTEVMVPVALPGLHTRVRLTRSEFEAMIRPALTETVGALRRALRSAGVSPADLRAILLAGGSSRIPLVTEVLGAAFGRPTVLDPHPEHSVALGAARLAGAAASGLSTVSPPVPAPASAPDGGSPGGPVSGTAGSGSGGRARSRKLTVVAAVTAVLVIGGAGAAIVKLSGGGDDDPAALGAGPASSAPASSAPACGFTDSFDAAALDPAWQRTRPDADLTVGGGTVTMAAPEGADLYDKYLDAPRLLRPATGDFVAQAELTADPRQFYQGAGLVLWAGPEHFARVERGYGQYDEIIFEYRNGGPHKQVLKPGQGPLHSATDRVVVELSRTAGTVRARWRPATTTTWQEIGSAELTLPAAVQIGPSVLNRAQRKAEPAPFAATFANVTLTC